MEDTNRPKKLTERFVTLSSNIRQSLRKKIEKPGKPNVSDDQDVPTTVTSSKGASSTKVDAAKAMAEVPKAEADEDEAILPTAEQAIVRGCSADGDGKSASPASVDAKASSETPPHDDISKRNIAVGSKSPVPSTLSRTMPTTRAWSPSVASIGPGSDAAALWDAAYDSLAFRSGALLHAYERMIGYYLARTDPEDQSERRPSAITVTMEEDSFCPDPFTRRRQMGLVIDIWLTDHDGNMTTIFSGESLIGEATRSLRDILQPSLERSRYASLPWAAACLAVESIFRQNSMSEANRSAIIEMVSKMEWYIGLSKLLVDRSDGGADEPGMSDSGHLKEKIIGLYKAILLFTIEQSVASMSQRNWHKPFGYHDDSTRQRVFDMEEALVRELGGSTIQFRLHQLLDDVKSARNTLKTDSEMTEEDKKRLNDLKTKLQLIEPPPFKAKTGKDDVLRLLYEGASATEEYKSFFQRHPDGLGGDGCRVLWVSGLPGAGKTMLMRATIQGLLEEAEAMSSTEKFNLAYFFSDSRAQPRGYVTQAIKSLIWQMLKSQPSLAKHMEDKFRSTGRDMFNDPNDFYAMSTVLYEMLDDDDHNEDKEDDDGDDDVDDDDHDDDNDGNANDDANDDANNDNHDDDTTFGLTYVIVDAIEELCIDDDSETAVHPDSAVRDLLRLIIKTAEVSPHIRWLVSVDHDKVAAELTPTDGIRQMRLDIDDERYSKDLRDVVIKEHISSKVAEVAKASGFREPFQSQVTAKFSATAPRNFLWVNMACRRIESDGLPWNATHILDKLPKDVKQLYREVHATLDKLDSTKDQDMCRDILSTTAIAYRSLRKSEVESLVRLPAYVDLDIVVNKMCSFFLEMYNGNVCYVHPSARDFVRESLLDGDKVSSKHFEMTQRCLKHAIVVKGKSKSDTYAVTNWMRHLCEVRGVEDVSRAVQAVNQFFDDHFLEWAEILATQRLLPEAVVLLQRLNSSLQKTVTFSPPTKEQSYCLKNIQQALWLFTLHQSIKSAENLSPKYSLPFLPSESELRQKLFHKAIPWLDIAPHMDSSAALDKVVHVLEGHNDWVRCCCYSPDGRLIASGGDDGVVRFWDAETVKVQHTFNVGAFVYQVLFTSDQRLVALSERTIQIWDASTGIHLKSLRRSSGDFRDIHSSRDGKKLVAARGPDVVVFDITPKASGPWAESPLDIKNNIRYDVRSVRFSPDGALIAYTLGPQIFLWDVKSGKTYRSLDRHTSSIDGLAFWHNSKYLASGSDDKTVRVWETYDETGESLCVLEGHSDYVNCVTFSSDGSRLASGSTDSTIRIWVLKGWSNGSEEKPCYEFERLLRGHDGMIISLSFAPDGQQLISSSSDATVRVWDIGSTRQEADTGQDEAGQPKPSRLEGHSTAISFVAFSPNRKFFASASSDGRICLWDNDDGRLLCSFTEHEIDIMSLDFSLNDSTLVSASKDHTARVWDTGRQVILHRLRGHEDWVRCAMISPDGKLVASASDDRSVRVWDISHLLPAEAEDDDSDTEHRCFSGDKAHRDYVYAAAFSPKGRYLASSGDDLRILIWNLTLGDGDQEEPEIAIENASEDSVRGLVFTQDEARIVSCEVGGVVRIWHLETKTCEQILDPQGQFQFFRTIQFDQQSAKVLMTEIGAWPINIEAPPPSTSTSRSDIAAGPANTQLIRRTPPPWCPYGISNDREWITWNNKNLIFLPAQYRPSGTQRVACRIQYSKVVIGSDSGQVLFFKFSEKQSPDL